MSKELLENLLVEFDEMGFEPTTWCDTEREIDSFRNRLKQVLDYLKAIDKFADTMKHKLERWLDLLQADGCNSKSIVMNDIQYLLKELKESENT